MSFVKETYSAPTYTGVGSGSATLSKESYSAPTYTNEEGVTTTSVYVFTVSKKYSNLGLMWFYGESYTGPTYTTEGYTTTTPVVETHTEPTYIAEGYTTTTPVAEAYSAPTYVDEKNGVSTTSVLVFTVSKKYSNLGILWMLKIAAGYGILCNNEDILCNSERYDCVGAIIMNSEEF